MQFNEFQRRLKDCNLPPQANYLLSHMFEVQVEFSKQMDTLADLLLEYGDKLVGFVALSEADRQKVEMLRRGRTDPSVDVHSVMNDPEDK